MDSINILCATDNDYVPYCGIMLTSLFENNKDYKFIVYILTEGLSTKNCNELKELNRIYKNSLNIIKVDNETIKDFPIKKGDHVSIATYYRLLAPMLLPEEIDKILYLDCDMIVNGDISSLYNIDLEGYAVAAVADEYSHESTHYDRLSIPKVGAYFNAGMLVINIKFWRENSTAIECFKYIKENRNIIKFHDQDTLNAVLLYHKKLLPIKYNFQTGYLLVDLNLSKSLEEDIISTSKAPLIIHYTGSDKPWMRYSKQPYRDIFVRYKKMSLWSKHPFVKNLNSLKVLKYFKYNFILFLKNKSKYRKV